MSEKRMVVRVSGFAGVGLGIYWYAWGQVGWWAAIPYGVFWPVWLGFRIAEMLKLGR